MAWYEDRLHAECDVCMARADEAIGKARREQLALVSVEYGGHGAVVRWIVIDTRPADLDDAIFMAERYGEPPPGSEGRC